MSFFTLTPEQSHKWAILLARLHYNTPVRLRIDEGKFTLEAKEYDYGFCYSAALEEGPHGSLNTSGTVEVLIRTEELWVGLRALASSSEPSVWTVKPIGRMITLESGPRHTGLYTLAHDTPMLVAPSTWGENYPADGTRLLTLWSPLDTGLSYGLLEMSHGNFYLGNPAGIYGTVVRLNEAFELPDFTVSDVLAVAGKVVLSDGACNFNVTGKHTRLEQDGNYVYCTSVSFPTYSMGLSVMSGKMATGPSVEINAPYWMEVLSDPMLLTDKVGMYSDTENLTLMRGDAAVTSPISDNKNTPKMYITVEKSTLKKALKWVSDGINKVSVKYSTDYSGLLIQGDKADIVVPLADMRIGEITW